VCPPAASRVAGLLAAVALVAACAASTDGFLAAVSQRAAFDLSCPAAQMSVQSLGTNSYGVVGCDKKVSYTCVCMWHVWSTCTQPVCTLDGASQAVAPPRP